MKPPPHVFITSEANDPAITLDTDSPWWRWLYSHLLNPINPKPSVLYLRTDGDQRKMARFNAAAMNAGIDGVSLSPSSPSTAESAAKGTGYQQVVVLAGPQVWAFDHSAASLGLLLQSARVIVASGPSAAYLFDRYIPDAIAMSEHVGLIAKRGCGLLSGTVASRRMPDAVLLPPSSGQSRGLYFKDGVQQPHGAMPAPSEVEHGASQQPFGRPSRDRRDVQGYAVVVGGTPDGGFNSLPGHLLLRYLCLLGSRNGNSCVNVAYIGVAKGDAAAVQLDLAEGFREARLNVNLRFADMAVPHSEHINLEVMLQGAHVIIIGGGRTAVRQGVFAQLRISEMLEQAMRNGAVVAGLSDGALWLAEAGLSGDVQPEVTSGSASVKTWVAVHTEQSIRFTNAQRAVSDGAPRVLALPTLGLAVFRDGELHQAHLLADPDDADGSLSSRHGPDTPTLGTLRKYPVVISGATGQPQIFPLEAPVLTWHDTQSIATTKATTEMHGLSRGVLQVSTDGGALLSPQQ